MKTLLQLLLDNRRPAARSRIDAAKRDGGKDEPVVVYLYDPIVSDRWMAEYFGGVCAQDFVPMFDAIEAERILLRINCPGGDVFAMQAMMASVRRHKAHVEAVIDGIAASAATGIASVCDKVVMEPGALFMIHNSHGFAMGDRNDLRQLADVMEKVDDGLLSAYVEKSGQKPEDVRAWMDAETWMTAEAAKERGFADAIGDKPVKASAEWKLAAFANAPKVGNPDPEASAAPTEPEPPTAQYASEEHRERQRQRVRVAALLAPPIHAPSRM